MALKLVWRFVNTVPKEGPDVYRMVFSSQRWVRESPAAKATSLIQLKSEVNIHLSQIHFKSVFQNS